MKKKVKIWYAGRIWALRKRDIMERGDWLYIFLFCCVSVENYYTALILRHRIPREMILSSRRVIWRFGAAVTVTHYHILNVGIEKISSRNGCVCGELAARGFAEASHHGWGNRMKSRRTTAALALHPGASTFRAGRSWSPSSVCTARKCFRFVHTRFTTGAPFFPPYVLPYIQKYNFFIP